MQALFLWPEPIFFRDFIYDFLDLDDKFHKISIIDSLGGELDIETENGRKTVASFWFPCRMKDCNKKQL